MSDTTDEPVRCPVCGEPDSFQEYGRTSYTQRVSLLRDDDGEDSAEPAPLALDHGAHTGLLEDIQAPSPPILPQVPTPHLLAPPQSTPAHRATPSS